MESFFTKKKMPANKCRMKDGIRKPPSYNSYLIIDSG